MRITLQESVGEFQFGLTVNEILQLTENLKMDIVYDGKNPMKTDITVHLVDLHVVLYFDGVSQMLNGIKVEQIGKCSLEVDGVCFTNGDEVSTLLSIYNLFGPTQEGHFEKQYYVLKYPGAVFRFKVPEECQNSCDIRMELPNGDSPQVSDIWFFADIAKHPKDNWYDEKVVVWSDPVRLEFQSRKKKIQIGDSPQYVFSMIGRPDSSFKRRDHFYFHNYKSMGIDILYEPEANRVIQIILRTNVLGQAEFSAYRKCNFVLTPPTEHVLKNCAECLITSTDKWSDVLKCFPSCKDSPLVHNAISATQPFGSTRFFTPYPGCFLEITQSDNIASIHVS